jgi:hypothetical protein
LLLEDVASKHDFKNDSYQMMVNFNTQTCLYNLLYPFADADLLSQAKIYPVAKLAWLPTAQNNRQKGKPLVYKMAVIQNV